MGLSWPEAFKKALIAILYAIFWIFFGAFTIFAGTIVSVSLAPGSPETADLIFLIFSLVGMLISLLGYSASIIKVAADS